MKRVFFIVVGQFLLAAGVSAGVVSVTLHTPTNRYLADESVPVSIIVSNGTASSFFVDKAAPFQSSQLYWCVSPQEQMDALARNHHILIHPRNAWRYVTQPQIGNRELFSGERIVWDYGGMPCSIPSRIFEHFTNINLYVQVLVGSNVWACSNTNWVKSTTVMIGSGTLLLESLFMSSQRISFPFNVKIYEHIIDGERFLFDAENRKRICFVPKNSTPGFSVNTNAATMTITFSGTHAPPINYNLNGE
jgi:hypothetical protein